MAEYVVAMVVYVAAFFVALLFGWQICRSIVWQPGDPLYRMLTWARDNAPLVVAAGLLAGWLVVTYLFLRRPLKYLDDVVDAAQRLAARSDTAVSLPPAMREIESQLNLVREQSMRAGLEAREAERRKNDLLVYLAHDLKTPLTSVIGYLNLLNDEPDLSPALRARYAGIALDKALRLEDLLNEFFEITRFNLSRIELETREVDLTRMLEQVADEFAPALAEKGMRCELRLPPRTPYVCDPDKLARVFDNLLRNACNYGDPRHGRGDRRPAGRIGRRADLLQFRPDDPAREARAAVRPLLPAGQRARHRRGRRRAGFGHRTRDRRGARRRDRGRKRRRPRDLSRPAARKAPRPARGSGPPRGSGIGL